MAELPEKFLEKLAASLFRGMVNPLSSYLFQSSMPLGCTRNSVVGDGTAGHAHGRREAELRVPT